MIYFLVIPLLYIFIQFWQLGVLRRYQSNPKRAFEWRELPEVSIWVACRNEEKNLAACLDLPTVGHGITS